MNQVLIENSDEKDQETETIPNGKKRSPATVYMETVAALKFKAGGNDILTFDI